MRFLIDVCVGGRLSVWLSEIGHDVKEVRSINPSMSDEEIMELALIEKRIIITADKDFGELYIRKGKMHCGIIRVADVPFDKRKSLIKRVLQEHADDLSNIIIVSTNHIRIRRI